MGSPISILPASRARQAFSRLLRHTDSSDSRTATGGRLLRDDSAPGSQPALEPAQWPALPNPAFAHRFGGRQPSAAEGEVFAPKPHPLADARGRAALCRARQSARRLGIETCSRTCVSFGSSTAACAAATPRRFRQPLHLRQYLAVSWPTAAAFLVRARREAPLRRAVLLACRRLSLARVESGIVTAEHSKRPHLDLVSPPLPVARTKRGAAPRSPDEIGFGDFLSTRSDAFRRAERPASILARPRTVSTSRRCAPTLFQRRRAP